MQGMSLPADLSGVLTSMAPPAVGNTSTAGTSNMAARADHTHTTSVQRNTVTLDANGEATWTFTTPYPSLPAVTYGVEVPSGLPVNVVLKSVSTTSVTVKGYQIRVLPSSLVTLTALQSFDVTAGTTPVNVKVHLMAGKITG